MSRQPSISDILEMTVDERIALVEAIWDSIAECPDSIVLTQAQQRELDARFEAYKADPTAGSPWNAVQARILDRG